MNTIKPPPSTIRHTKGKRHLLSRDELLGLSEKALRKQCELVGIIPRSGDKRDELIGKLYAFYHSAENENFEDNADDYLRPGDSPGRHRSRQRGNIDEEALQMLEALQQIIPYYGKGDLQTDNIVRDTVRRLPREALEMRDMYGNTLIMQACQSGAQDLVPLLISRGSDVNARNHDGATCLHFACYTDSLSINVVQVLLKNGARAEVVENQYGCTPLHWAASAGDLVLCKMLCEAGADASTVDSSGYDPIAYARQSKSVRCVEYLLGIRKSMKEMNNIQRSIGVESSWQRHIDYQSGQAYYYNTDSGESLWEDEYYEWLKTNKSGKNLGGSNYNVPNRVDGAVLSATPSESYSRTGAVASGPVPVSSNSAAHTDNQPSSLQRVEVTLDSSAFELSVPGSPARTTKLQQKEADLTPKATSTRRGDAAVEKVRCGPDGIDPTGNTGTVPKSEQTVKAAVQEMCSEAEPSKPANDITITRFDGVRAVGTEVRATAAKETFDDRLASLQVKMEHQLMEQLKRLEDKIVAPKESLEHLSKSSEALTEMSARIVKLQTDLGSKELEILSLRREVTALESKLAQSVASALSAVDRLVDEGWWSPEKVKALKGEVGVKQQQLDELQANVSELGRKLDKAIRELDASTEKSTRQEQKIQFLEVALDEERLNKERSMKLLEQSKRGLAVDLEIAKSLEDARAREKVLITKLQSELATVEAKADVDKKQLSDRIEERNNQLVEEREKVLKLEADVENLKRMLDEEARHVKDARSSELSMLQGQLNEERISRMEKDVQLKEIKQALEDARKERDEAKGAMQETMKHMQEAEVQVQGMKAMVNDAKLLMSQNEKLHRELHIETDRRKELHNKLEDLKGRIRVYVRIRPLSSNEKEKECKDVLRKEDKRTCVMLPESDDLAEAKSWEFDQVFCGTSPDENTQEAVFQDTRQLVTSAVDGVNVCVFAYGQTGSGKTYTMFGRNGLGNEINADGALDAECGLAPRAAEEVFKVIREKEGSSDTSVYVSMFELYTDGLGDLLASNHDCALKIRLAEHSETGMVEVDNTVKASVNDARELLGVFKKGVAARTTSATKMNADSSRSHLVTMIVTCVKNRRTGNVVRGKLTLVDLAGSERVSKSGAAGQQLKEAQSINKSLSALGDVISALTCGNKHIPYRNHPLTMLMSDSIGGNAKTLMFVCCSPADYNRAESSNSLDFAKRCKDVKNNVSGGNNDQASQVRALRAELTKLKKERGEVARPPGSAARRPGIDHTK